MQLKCLKLPDTQLGFGNSCYYQFQTFSRARINVELKLLVDQVNKAQRSDRSGSTKLRLGVGTQDDSESGSRLLLVLNFCNVMSCCVCVQIMHPPPSCSKTQSHLLITSFCKFHYQFGGKALVHNPFLGGKVIISFIFEDDDPFGFLWSYFFQSFLKN